MATALQYTCGICNRSYQRKNYYNRHILVCEIISKSVKERRLENEEQRDTPSVRILYEVILDLTSKITKMDLQIQKLTTFADQKKRKIDMLDWLNTNQVTDVCGSFEQLLLNIQVSSVHLEHLFQSDYTPTILHILQEHIPLDDGLKVQPIKAFMQKTNVLYVYNTDSEKPATKKWLLMTETMLQTLIYFTDKKLLAEFIKWQNNNADKMKDDNFAIKYATYVKKVMGGKLTREQIYSRVKIDLYNYLKVCVKNIVEYEFV